MSFLYVASGFRQDMEELIHKFVTPDCKTSDSPEQTSGALSLRFSRFCDIWRQMKFSLVFRLRTSENDLREFVEEIYLLVLPNICSEYPFERRVCALYLLYSLFIKQPKTIEQKIRINGLYLEETRELVRRAKQFEQLDVWFIWQKLWSLGAIDIVLVSRRLGPYYIQNNRKTTGVQTKTDFLMDQMKTSVYPAFNELSQIHDKYQDMKQELTNDLPQIHNELNTVTENVFDSGKVKAEQMFKSSVIAVNQPSVQTKSFSAENEMKATNKRVAETEISSDIGFRPKKLKERSLNLTNKTGEHTIHSIVREYKSKCLEKSRRGRPKSCKYT